MKGHAASPSPARSSAGLDPIVHFIRTTDKLAALVERYAGTRMVCYSLNPRPTRFWNDRGYVRSARESEIEVSQNLVLDIDSIGDISLDRSAVARFLKRVQEYCRDSGLCSAVPAFSGRGCHLLFAYPAVGVAEHPDIGTRLRAFRDHFARLFRDDLSRLEASLDETQDLRRLVKVYGTAKPGALQSHFTGAGNRVEDEAHRDYLLGLDVTSTRHSVPQVEIRRELPDWFTQLLRKDAQTRRLWLGTSKPHTSDTTRSGYDFSLTRQLLRRGHTDLQDLAAILANRPNGSVQQRSKGDAYIWRTILNCLARK